MTWTDYPGGSVRSDGAKVGEFFMGNSPEWWGYPVGWTPRNCPEVSQAIGPHASRQQAKQAIDYLIAGMV